MSNDKRIAEVLAKFDEPMAGNVWRVQGTAVIYHKTLERIAAQAKISFDEPKIIRAERDEAVIQVTGRLPDGRSDWSIGEALINVNYRVSGKQAAYPYAMAMKRARDRVILSLIELAGEVYSEEESDDFRQGKPEPEAERFPGDHEARRDGGRQFSSPSMHNPPTTITSTKPTASSYDDQVRLEGELQAEINRCQTHNAVTDFMLKDDTQKKLETLSKAAKDDVRAYAAARMKALGWGQKAAS